MNPGLRVIRGGGSARRVGLIGMGIMGSAIARNLTKAGFQVVGYDIDKARAAEMRAAKVDVQESVTAVATSTSLLLTSLPSAEALDATVKAIAGVEARHRPGLAVAELSTLPLDCKLRNRDLLGAAGIVMLDCPLSGTGAQAATGDLAVYASGDAAAFEDFKPVFAGFARVSHYLGAFGNGTKMKLVANLLVAIHNVAAAEAVVLGLKAGLEPATLCAVLGSGAGGSRMFDLRAPMMVDNTYTPATMKLDVWRKDMALIEALAKNLGVQTPLFSATAPLYEAAVKAGRGHEDTAAVCTVLEGMAGGRGKP